MVKKLIGKISKIENLTPDVKHFEIELPENLEFKAGQFINLSFKENENLFRRPFSIASNPSNSNTIELCIKLVENGEVTPKLWGKKTGDEVEIMGALGLFTTENSKKDKLVFIGTGTGIAPLRSIIKDELKKNHQKEMLLIFGVRHKGNHLYEKEFDKLEKENANLKIIKVLSRPDENWDHRSGHVQHNFDVVDPINSEFYICGLPQMVEESIEKLETLGVVKDQIKHEKYV